MDSPSANGLGWETTGVSVTLIEISPWAIATREIVTSLPRTMVPDCSSITIRAGTATSIGRFSMLARTREGEPCRLRRSISTVPGSRI